MKTAKILMVFGLLVGSVFMQAEEISLDKAKQDSLSQGFVDGSCDNNDNENQEIKQEDLVKNLKTSSQLLGGVEVLGFVIESLGKCGDFPEADLDKCQELVRILEQAKLILEKEVEEKIKVEEDQKNMNFGRIIID